MTEEYYLQYMQVTLKEVGNELRQAKVLHPDFFKNQHEAYAVILEEVDELWTEIKKKERNYNISAQRKEAIQAAAMLVRLVIELLPNQCPITGKQIDIEPGYEVDYRQLLVRYIAHISAIEGTAFIDGHTTGSKDISLTDQEKYHLQLLELEADQIYKF